MSEEATPANCPFCGSASIHVDSRSNDEREPGMVPYQSYRVVCDVCGVQGPERVPRHRAIEHWNTRVTTWGESHWKNNHDSVVRKSRVLIDRPDMPLERVKAFHYITQLEDRIRFLESQQGS